MAICVGRKNDRTITCYVRFINSQFSIHHLRGFSDTAIYEHFIKHELLYDVYSYFKCAYLKQQMSMETYHIKQSGLAKGDLCTYTVVKARMLRRLVSNCHHKKLERDRMRAYQTNCVWLWPTKSRLWRTRRLQQGNFIE